MNKLLGTNQFIAIMVGMVLFTSAFIGQIPFAVADDDDDDRKKNLKDKLEKLKELAKKYKNKDRDRDKHDDDDDNGKHNDDDDGDDKCPDKFAYNGFCDKEKPKIKIKNPEKKDKLPAGIVTFEIEAKDKISGIKKVEVRIIRDGNYEATHVSGDMWELDVDLDKGRYVAIAKAIDKVGNSKRDVVVFRVV